jgi:hypothetical protein
MPMNLVLIAAMWTASMACEARCRCMESGSVAAMVTRRAGWAERVVLGTVVDVDTLAPTTSRMGQHTFTTHPIVARVLVRHVWKGPVTDTMTVMFATAVTQTSCSIDLRLGVSYLVFGRTMRDGSMATNWCSGTIEERQGAATLAALGSGKRVKR